VHHAKLIDAEVALDTRRNKHSSWRKAKDRLGDEVWPAMNPSFQIHAGAKVFTIGSCFARNIEEHLQRLGFSIPTLRFQARKEEWPARANGILNKYTPAAIFQEIDWARKIFTRDGVATESDSTAFLFPCPDGSCIDLNLGRYTPVTRERFFQRRAELYDVFREVFSSDYVVITLGLIEAWFDRENGIYLQEAPVKKDFDNVRPRFGFHVLTYEQSRQFIQDTIDIIRKLNPNAKFLITTSPIPLAHTFTELDVIIANSHSKSVLRAVAGEVSATNESVDYFPSYESVMLARSGDIWKPDRLHVTDAFVGKIVARLTDAYCTDLSRSQKLFLQSYIQLKGQSIDDALQLARQAVEGSPDNPDLCQHYGILLAQSGDLAAAQAQYTKSLALKPDDPRLHYQLSELLARRGHRQEATIMAIRSTQLAPDDDVYHRHLARLWFRQWQFGKAAVEYALAWSHLRLIKSKSRNLKHLLRLILPRLERTRHIAGA
jgi:tetratricopeptide (TPR) repeat protein